MARLALADMWSRNTFRGSHTSHARLGPVAAVRSGRGNDSTVAGRHGDRPRDVARSHVDVSGSHRSLRPARTRLNAISVTNPAALEDAAKMDAERRTGKLRGPLHGIPVIVKDNYETANMQTADGSASLKGWIPPDDAYLVRR